MTRQLLWFGAVGVSAMLVHFITVALVLVPLGLAPLLANIGGFLVAFQLSYWGHRRLTFRISGSGHAKPLPRFFAVASLGFATNELMYFLLLRYSAIDYRLALIIVLFLVAAMTFLLSKLWAFAD